MAILTIPDEQRVISSPDEIGAFLNQKGIFFRPMDLLRGFR